MITGRACPKCQTRLPRDGLDGLCPKCLVQVCLKPMRLFGDYELEEEIGRGGMGVVYKARQVSLERVVALKMILSGRLASDSWKQRFETEAKAAARLRHPNLVSVHEVGEWDGFHYFTMDYIDGKSLAELVEDGPMEELRAARYVRIVAEAIHYAHSHGILHRDLKPSNVMIDSRDQPQVMDFGLAKLVADDSALTLTGEILGSPNYLPPEQAKGETGKLGPASDVYSLGAVLYHLVTGRRPFLARTMEETLSQVVQKEPVSPRLLNPSVPRDLETICGKCMEKTPERRYPSAHELAEDLDRFLRDEPILARPVTRSAKILRWCRREPALAGLGMGILVLLLVVAVGSTWTALNLEQKRREEHLQAYTADMFQAQTEWKAGNPAETLFYLRRYLPRPGEADLRGFEWRHLWRECRGDYAFALPAHNQVAGAIGFSPSGQAFSAFYWDNVLRVWNLPARTDPLTYQNVTARGGFTADGQQFMVGYENETVNLCQTGSGAIIQAWPEVGELVAFAANGGTFATMDRQNHLRVRDLNRAGSLVTLPEVQRRRSDFSWAPLLAFSPDGRTFATLVASTGIHSSDLGIRLRDSTSGKELRFLPRRGQFHSLCFSPQGTVLAVGDARGATTLWDIATGKTTELVLTGHDSPILALAFSPDGEFLGTGSSDQSIALWNLQTLTPSGKAFRGQVGAVWALAFSPDGKFLASSSRDSPIKFWNLTTNDLTRSIGNLKSDRIGNFAFSSDGKLMAGGCQDNRVRIWDVETMTERYQRRGVSYVVAFTTDGQRLLVSTEQGQAHWWGFEANTMTAVPEYTQLDQIASVALSPDRRVAAVGRDDGLVQLLEIDTGQIVGTYRGHEDSVLAVAFAPGGRRFASGGRDKTIRLWETAVEERSLEICAEHKGAVGALAISPDGRNMASGCSANTIKFWDLGHLRKSLGAIPWHRSVIRSLAFSQDGATLASGSEDKTVRLWHTRSHRQTGSFAFEDAIRLVVFSPDNNNLAVVTDKGTLTLLRASTLRDADAQAAQEGLFR